MRNEFTRDLWCLAAFAAVVLIAKTAIDAITPKIDGITFGWIFLALILIVWVALKFSPLQKISTLTRRFRTRR